MCVVCLEKKTIKGKRLDYPEALFSDPKTHFALVPKSSGVACVSEQRWWSGDKTDESKLEKHMLHHS